MKSESRPIRRDAPHPLVTFIGVAIAFALIWIALKTTLMARSTAIIVTIAFVLVFRWVSRWSAKVTREKRERELEDIRSRPVLGLND